MPEYVSAYTDDESNTVVTVTKGYAEARGLKTLKSDDPLDRRGRPRGPREGNRTSATTAAKSTTTGGSPASKPEEGSKS